MTDETITKATIDELPHYVYCNLEGCNNRHYLSFNRDVQGKWSVVYIAFETNMACLFVSDAASLEEGATRMKYSLERHKFGQDANTSNP